MEYKFLAKVWQYPSPEGWFFVSLPEEMASEIRENFQNQEEGWGRLKVTAKVSQSEWKTSMWFDTKYRTYLLPLKSEIRRRESIAIDQTLTITITIDQNKL
jgi:hypothetical protein